MNIGISSSVIETTYSKETLEKVNNLIEDMIFHEFTKRSYCAGIPEEEQYQRLMNLMVRSQYHLETNNSIETAHFVLKSIAMLIVEGNNFPGENDFNDFHYVPSEPLVF